MPALAWLRQVPSLLAASWQSPAEAFPASPHGMNLRISAQGVGETGAVVSQSLIAHFDFDHRTITYLPMRSGAADASCNHYLLLSPENIAAMIQAIGGVNVLVSRRIDYDNHWSGLHLHLKPGYQHLDAAQALEFAQGCSCDNSLQRLDRQRQILTALKDRLRQPQIWIKIPSLISAGGAVKTDLNTVQVIVLARFLHSIVQVQRPPDPSTACQEQQKPLRRGFS